MAESKVYGTCACGCGEPITHSGSSYAGEDEATRNKHRAKAAYKRKTGQADARPAGTREALAALGLADDVPIADLARTLAAATSELARRTSGVDSTAVQREIERGLAEARQQVETAEAGQARAVEQRSQMAEELEAAVERADRADEDAAAAGDRAEELDRQLAVAVKEKNAAHVMVELEERHAHDAIAKADRAEAVLAEVRQEHERTLAEMRRTAEEKAARADALLAQVREQYERTITEMRQEHERILAEVRRSAEVDTRYQLTELRGELNQKAAEQREKAVADAAAQRERLAQEAAEQRNTLVEQIAALRSEVATAKAQAIAQEARAERAEALLAEEGRRTQQQKAPATGSKPQQ